MKSCELVTFITAVACNMANCYSVEELTLFSAIFSQLGDTLETILSIEELSESSKDSDQDNTSNKCEDEDRAYKEDKKCKDTKRCDEDKNCKEDRRFPDKNYDENKNCYEDTTKDKYYMKLPEDTD